VAFGLVRLAEDGDDRGQGRPTGAGPMRVLVRLSPLRRRTALSSASGVSLAARRRARVDADRSIRLAGGAHGESQDGRHSRRRSRAARCPAVATAAPGTFARWAGKRRLLACGPGQRRRRLPAHFRTAARPSRELGRRILRCLGRPRASFLAATSRSPAGRLGPTSSTPPPTARARGLESADAGVGGVSCGAHDVGGVGVGGQHGCSAASPPRSLRPCMPIKAGAGAHTGAVIGLRPR
jgi:hypothetical protein